MDTIDISACWKRDISEKQNGLCCTKFRENSSIIVIGRSGSGKTTFVYNVLRNASKLFQGNKKIKILYLYKSNQDLFTDMELNIPNIEFHRGMMNLNDILSRHPGSKSHHMILFLMI